MKGIILAGGSGTRLQPITSIISKQLLPIFDKPMIFYPLVTLMELGIREIIIIVTPYDLERFKSLLGKGDKYGIKIEYLIQDKPNGLAEAFIITKQKIAGSKTTLILGDNIFHSNSINENVIQEFNSGVKIFSYIVKDPERYGVVEFDKANKAISIEEKPVKPKSNYAVPGLYFYDNRVVEFAKSVKPSSRGEKEITSINKMYLDVGALDVGIMTRGMTWLDTGTVESMDDATEFVRVIEKRTDKKIACIEEIAFLHGFINKTQALKVAEKYEKSPYGDYIKKVIE